MSTSKKSYKLFKVQLPSGHATTVSMDPVLFLRACQVLGGIRVVRQLVHQAVAEHSKSDIGTFPRSRYVSQVLLEKIATA